MNLTNDTNLPEAIVEAVRKSTRGPAVDDRTFSVTEILSPPRIVWLKRRHHAEMTEDVADRIWAIYGQAMHAVLETAGVSNALTEERLRVQIDDLTLTGIPDFYKDGELLDYKNTSVWNVIYGSSMDDWTRQANFYAYMLREHGFPVNRVAVVAWMRDWQRSRVKDNYPRHPVRVIRLPIWTQEKARAEISARLQVIMAAKDDLPLCTPEERWEKETKYAVMKKGMKRAVRVFDDEPSAEAFMFSEKDKAKMSITVRPGEQTRCADYCAVSEFCSQWRTLRAANQEAAA